MYTSQVKGLAELQRKQEQMVSDLTGPEMLGAMRTATLLIQGTAKRESPVDTGRLRASITPVVEVRGSVVTGIVGTNVKYAPYMEMGTGIFAGGSRYFPPPAALDTWARRHGMSSGFAVAMAIYRAGGTKPRRMFQIAVEQNEGDIRRLIEGTVAVIVKK